MTSWTFTSESVTEGHPDKMADQISDAILDAILERGPDGPGGVRDAASRPAWPSSPVRSRPTPTSTSRSIVRETINEHRLRPRVVRLRRQHVRRAGVARRAVARHRPGRRRLRGGAHRARRGEDLLNSAGRRRPGDDVRLRLRRDRRPHAAADLAGAPHGRAPGRGAQGRHAAVPAPRRQDPGHLRLRGRQAGRGCAPCSSRRSTAPASTATTSIQPDLIEHVIQPVVPGAVRRRRLRRVRQPDRAGSCSAARMRDTGLTGRKIIVDTYGGMARHGGGAFSGKDPSKVDRSAAYAARWVAKNVVAVGRGARAARSRSPTPSAWPSRSRSWSRRSAPRRSTTPRIVEAVRRLFDLRPAAIIRDLDLRRPIYKRTAAYGHFGRPPTTAASPGSAPTRSTTCARRSGSDPPVPATAEADPTGRGARPAGACHDPGVAVGARMRSSCGCCRTSRPSPRPSTTWSPSAWPARCASARWCGSPCTAGGSGAGSWRSTSSRRPGVALTPIAKVTGWGPSADAGRAGRLGGVAVGRAGRRSCCARRRPTPPCRGCRRRRPPPTVDRPVRPAARRARAGAALDAGASRACGCRRPSTRPRSSLAAAARGAHALVLAPSAAGGPPPRPLRLRRAGVGRAPSCPGTGPRPRPGPR